MTEYERIAGCRCRPCRAVRWWLYTRLIVAAVLIAGVACMTWMVIA